MSQAQMRFGSSFQEGTAAEQEFIKLRGENFIRKASRMEDIHEHWDVLDKEYGRVDVKGAKRKYRNGPIDYSIHWWEFKNVAGRAGWGEPNDTERLIAFRTENAYVLVDPSKVNALLEAKCVDHFRGPWGLNTRKGRQDLAAMVPTEFFVDNSEHILEISFAE